MARTTVMLSFTFHDHVLDRLKQLQWASRSNFGAAIYPALLYKNNDTILRRRTFPREQR